MLSLRPTTDADLPLLLEIYAATRAEELAVTGWSPEQKNAFLQQQFFAQHHYCREHYKFATFDLILKENIPVGRLYVARWETQIRVIDIAILPPYRGSAIGTNLITSLLTESRNAGVPLTIHVERENPALAWYARLGFEVIEDKGAYLFLQVA